MKQMQLAIGLSVFLLFSGWMTVRPIFAGPPRNDSLNNQQSLSLRLEKNFVLFSADYSLMKKIRFSVLENRYKIWRNAGGMYTAGMSYTYPAALLFDARQVLAYHKIFSREMWQRSGFIPSNVQNYLDFKMGRDEYLPVAGWRRPGVISNWDHPAYNPFYRR
jgi:hypothetical protein